MASPRNSSRSLESSRDSEIDAWRNAKSSKPMSLNWCPRISCALVRISSFIPCHSHVNHVTYTTKIPRANLRSRNWRAHKAKTRLCGGSEPEPCLNIHDRLLSVYRGRMRRTNTEQWAAKSVERLVLPQRCFYYPLDKRPSPMNLRIGVCLTVDGCLMRV